MRKVDEGRIIERQSYKRNQKTLARYFLSISFSNWNFNIINNNSQTNLTLFSRNRNIKNIVTLKKTKIKIRRDSKSLNFSKFDSSPSITDKPDYSDYKQRKIPSLFYIVKISTNFKTKTIGKRKRGREGNEKREREEEEDRKLSGSVRQRASGRFIPRYRLHFFRAI